MTFSLNDAQQYQHQKRQLLRDIRSNEDAAADNGLGGMKRKVTYLERQGHVGSINEAEKENTPNAHVLGQRRRRQREAAERAAHLGAIGSTNFNTTGLSQSVKECNDKHVLGQRRRRQREVAERAAHLTSQSVSNLDPATSFTYTRALGQQLRYGHQNMTEFSTTIGPQPQNLADNHMHVVYNEVHDLDIPQTTIVTNQCMSKTSCLDGYLISAEKLLSVHLTDYDSIPDLFLAGRRPYREPSRRHDLGRMDVRCAHCGALHWAGERLSGGSKNSPRFSMCCLEGKVDIPLLQPPPEPLQALLAFENPRKSELFLKTIWQYNCALSFTSLGVTEDKTVNTSHRGPPVFRISGELHHNSGALEPAAGHDPRFAQLYVYEPHEALEYRVQHNVNLDRSLMTSLQEMLLAHHQYVPLYKQAYEILQGYDPSNDVEVRLRVMPRQDRRRYNLPTIDEVAVVLADHGNEARDVVLRLRASPNIHRISDLHPAYVPLQYPLLFPYGEHGWHSNMVLHETERQQTKRIAGRQERARQRQERGIESVSIPTLTPSSRRLTLTSYVAFRVQFRGQMEWNTLLRGGRLFCRYMVDMFASADQQRLRYIENNQDKFRAAQFNNLEDAVAQDGLNLDLNDLGKRVILPSSYIGGPRNLGQCFQDSMAIARHFRKVDAFLTMTANPKWPEITRELLPGQTAYDRPDLVARVFQLKRKALMDLICKHGIFGSVPAYVYTIEFQKRGLPHMHALIFFDDDYKLTTPEAVDSCIWARWPDPETQPKLFQVVKKCMVHGPCGELNPTAPCMDPITKKCTKGFPKAFQDHTSMDSHGYPLYFRPDDGRAYEVDGMMIDNRWLVAFPPFLCVEMECHINMECAVSLGSFKYSFKYILKGTDRGMLEVEKKNEVKRWVDGRFITAPEAAWRIFHFNTHEMVPNVVRLQVHLKGQQMIMYNPNQDLAAVLQRGLTERTTLTAFFEANADPGPLGEIARLYTYQEFPQHFVYVPNTRGWKLRDQGFALGRMYFIKPTEGEQFYLRTLLTVVKGPISFEDLYRVPRYTAPFPTYHAACLARGLLEDDGEWRICLREASEMQTGTRLRHLFATLLLFSELSQPDILWMEFRAFICDDLEHHLRSMAIENPSDDDIYDYGLFQLERILADAGHTLSDWPSMPLPQQDWARRTINPLIVEQLNYNRAAEFEKLQERLAVLNDDQRSAYDAVMSSLNTADGAMFFLNGPGGTGKTFLYNTICSKLRSDGEIILCVSSSGISALLLKGGRTAHSTFKIPVDNLSERSFCNIPKQSTRADLIRATKVVIWDEVGAQHRFAIEAVDRTFRDLCESDHPFGGKVVILGGDFLQTLPVVEKGSREDIVDATIQSSMLWPLIKILRLHQNMRVDCNEEGSAAFAQWLLDIGHGRNMVHENEIHFPEYMEVDKEETLIQSIYPGIASDPPPPPEYFLKRMILAPRNANVQDLNEKILKRMAGESRQYISADSIIYEAGADPDNSVDYYVPVEFLRAIAASGLPPGELNVKVGCPIILLRNLSPTNGLCNGTRLVVTRMRDRVIEAKIIGDGPFNGQLAFIPRISLTPSSTHIDVNFHFRRRQFPIRLSFALSINKAQGQSVVHVGLYLTVPVFAHGQLYVALSRATSSRNIKILLGRDSAHYITKNIVYPEVIL